MVNMKEIVILTLFFLPLLLSVFYAVINRQYWKWLIFLQQAIVFVGTLSVLLLGIKDFATGLSFLNEPIYLEFSTTPAILFLFIQFALWIYLVNSDWCENSSRFHVIVLNIALAFGFVSFFSGQFMIRYIALEIVGLCVALSAIESFANRSKYKKFGFIFLILRTGDIGLWTSILILQNHAQSLDISEMISAASQLSLLNQAWVLAGFLFAVLVKTAILPFGLWLQFSGSEKNNFINWVPKILMPSLGLYLLYRIKPLIQSHEILIGVTGFFIVSLIVLLMVLHRLGRLKVERWLLFYSLIFGMSVYLSTFSSSTLFSYYIWAAILFITFLIVENQLYRTSPFLLKAIVLMMMNGAVATVIFQNHSLYIFVIWVGLTLLVTDWVSHYQLSMKLQSALFNKQQKMHVDYHSEVFTEKSTKWLNKVIARTEKSAYWFYQQCEIKIFANIFPMLSKTLINVSEWTSLNIEMGLTRVWVGSIRGVVKISELTRTKIEATLEGTLVNISNQLVKLSNVTLIQLEDGGSKKTSLMIKKAINQLGIYDNQTQKKSLRWDLFWVPIILVVIIIFLIIS